MGSKREGALFFFFLRVNYFIIYVGTPGVCAWKWNIVKEKEEIKSDGRRKILYTNQYELTL